VFKALEDQAVVVQVQYQALLHLELLIQAAAVVVIGLPHRLVLAVQAS
jgi:hypothetical protein